MKLGVLAGWFMVAALTLRAGSIGPDRSANDDPLREWLQRLNRATDPVAFEGLPSPFSDPATYSKELAAKEHFAVGGDAFYTVALPLAPEFARRLRTVLESRATFAHLGQPMPRELCGGFYADYAVRWSLPVAPDAKIKSAYLWARVCFSCHEIILSEGEDWSLHTDPGEAGYAELSAILLGLGKQRPPYGAASLKPPVVTLAAPDRMPMTVPAVAAVEPAQPTVTKRGTFVHHASASASPTRARGFRKSAGFGR